MNDRLHVLFTTAWYPNRKVAGDGVFVQKHAIAVSHRHDVAVIMVQSDVAVTGFHIDVDARENPESSQLYEVRTYVPKVKIEIPLITGLLRFLLLLIGYWMSYREVKRYWQCRPDVSHVNVLTRAALLPWMLKQLHGIPYIITEHWSRYGRKEFPHSKFHLCVTQWMVAGASYVCPVSHNLEENMLHWQLCNPHYERVNNVVDTDLFAAKEPEAPHHIKRLVHVSWLRDASKNISGILQVMARLRDRRQDFELHIVGEGIDQDALQTLSHQLAQDAYVKFVGPKQRQSLADELHASDVLLMFSNYENQPVSILEALSVGIPVVATTVGDIRLMLDGRGVCVAPGDETALLQAIDYMLDHYTDYEPQALHDYVQRNYAYDEVSQRFTNLYQKAIKEH